MKKFDIVRYPIEVKYIRPFLGRIIAITVWLKFIKIIRCNIPTVSETVSFYWLIIPQFMKGG